MFDAGIDPDKIEPVVRRGPSNWFKVGELTRAVLNMLRTEPRGLSVREMATRLAQSLNVDMNDKAVAERLMKAAHRVASRQRDGLIVSEWRDGTMAWRLRA
jgi:hypothetical protein